MSEKKRIEWVDVAKGIGIILVSFGHIRNGDGQSVWLPALNDPINAVYLFHMPLFFFLGGLVFSNRRPFEEFAARRARTLLIPYYVFSIYFLLKPMALLLRPSLAGTFQSSHDYSIGKQFYGVLVNGDGLWFLWAYFVGEILAYGITKLVHGRITSAIIGLLLIAGYLCITHLLPWFVLPFQIIQGVEVAGFIMLGVACKQWVMGVPQAYAAIFFVPIVLAFALCSIPAVMGNVNEFSAIALSTASMFLGIAAVVSLSIACDHSMVLGHIGRHSIVYYAVNALMLNVAKLVVFRLLRIPGPSLPVIVQWGTGILVTALALLLMWVADLFVQRWMPWSIGCRRFSERR